VFAPLQWFGVAVLLAGIFGLAVYNLIYLENGRDTLWMAMVFAIATGLLVALYTTYDAYGIRAARDPFTFLAWFFLFDGLVLPGFIYRRWLRMPDAPALGPLMVRGCVGGLVAFMSFGSVMLATLLGKVGEAAVLRETSTIFAALIGWLVLKETVGPRRIGLMALIALGAVIVEVGG
jgi:drug/metabolite transporter (DMT)-like permease